MLCPAIHNIPNQIIDEVADENYINWNVKHSTRNSLKIPREASQKMNYCKYNFSWWCRGKKRVIAAVKFDEQLIFWSLGAWYVRRPKICRHVFFFFSVEKLSPIGYRIQRAYCGRIHTRTTVKWQKATRNVYELWLELTKMRQQKTNKRK